MLALTQNGISREDAYRIIQRNAMKVWEDRSSGKGSLTLREELEKDSDVTDKLSAGDLDGIFSYDHYTKNIPHIMERALAD